MLGLLRQIKRRAHDLGYVLAFPVFSLLSPRVGFTLFFVRAGRWHAYTRGRSFPVPQARLWALEYFRHFIPPSGATVFDVGGEFGVETEQFAQLVGPQGKVFVFECLPVHVGRLEQLARLHRQVTVIDRACWDEARTLEFFAGNTAGSGTAVPDAKGQHGQALANLDQRPIVVQAERLDELWKRHHGGQPVDFLKMDIEGSEYEALDGATEMLQHTRKAVIAAYHLRDGVATALKVDQKLRAAGFQTRIDENNHVYAWRA